MKYRAIVRPEAENDLREAFLWYEDKRPGLGYDFLLQVEAGLRFIERNPEISPLEYKERIIVLAVIHGKRSPNLIKKRIDSSFHVTALLLASFRAFPFWPLFFCNFLAVGRQVNFSVRRNHNNVSRQLFSALIN